MDLEGRSHELNSELRRRKQGHHVDVNICHIITFHGSVGGTCSWSLQHLALVPDRHPGLGQLT